MIQIGAGIGQMFEAVKPDPWFVAEAIIGLINAPKGKWPLRTVVDAAAAGFTETGY